MNKPRRWTSLWPSAALGALAFALLLLWPSVHLLAAEVRFAPAAASTPTPTATVVPTRNIGWMNRTSASAPEGLQRTAFVSGAGGGGGGPILCPYGLALATNQDAWMLSPSSGMLLLGATYHPPIIRVEKCGGSDFAKDCIILVGPDNRSFTCVWPGPPEDLTCNLRDFYGSQIPTGDYMLIVESPTGVVRRVFSVQPYPENSAWMRLSNAATGEDTLTFQSGSIMQIDLMGVGAGAVVELGLYRYGGKGLILVDTWQDKADAQGAYRVRLPTPNVTDTYFLLMACELDSCGLWLPPFGDEIGYNALFESFSVVGGGNTEVVPYIGGQVVVDPVAAWDGLNMRSGPAPTYRQIGSAKPYAVVTILQGPQMAGVNPWYRVQDAETNLVGWVNGNYLKPLAYSPWDDYVSLWWVPGCDPQRAEVALVREGQTACGRGVATRSLDWLTSELRAQGLLAAGERLVPVALGGKANQGLEIRTNTRARLGWIRIGGEAPVGGVWRITYAAPERQVGKRCWLRLDMTWRCE